ncbi:unnamed protein product [Ectocarpus sp. 13 AM-2016]
MPRKSCRNTASSANPTFSKTGWGQKSVILLQDPLRTVHPSKRRG